MTSMQLTAVVIFLSCAAIVAYTYVVYPLLLVVASAFIRRPEEGPMEDEALPTVTIMIPAYNEELVIAHKLESTLALDYPAERLEIIVVSDMSTDATESIVGGFADRGVRLIRNESQKGKIASLSDVGREVQSDLILITDANAIFEPDSLRKLVTRFRDPAVGIVNGNKLLTRTPTMVGDGEGTYQAYENVVKRADSEVLSNAFVTGAMTAIRRELFTPLPGYLEFDHVLPLVAVNRGYRVVFEEDARFHEETAPSTRAEYKVRVRNAVRGFTMVLLMGRYLNVLRHPAFTFHVYSRKILRWLIAVPAAGMFVANIGLLQFPFWQVVFAGQVLFYLAALAGYVSDRYGFRQGVLALPFYFCLVNFACLVGLVQAVRGQRVAVWGTGRS